MSSRIGVFGGMFDPVHNGHLELARSAIKELQLDQLRMVPCHQPNHRLQPKSSSTERVAMLKLATTKFDSIIIDSQEIERNGTSYTAATLANLKSANPNSSLVLLVGVDSFNTLADWHNWESIIELSHVVVFARAGENLTFPKNTQKNLNECIVKSPAELFGSNAGSIYLLDGFNYDASSTEVRTRIAERSNFSELLPAVVCSYIADNELYNDKK
ncbi:MAG TPA: nicotinate-nucleotide adenylyltransferase [Porticoccaceae bacterium]|jgi:nicotinate-nucleotide adenylyltransferase|nr:nicotinate-nucleotide adenylyltransferase [Gammaproteobacteria bacterium]HIL61765.1 nicotinate-nucleotide adenylyltransferase [Porticoccaceae bacterium]